MQDAAAASIRARTGRGQAPPSRLPAEVSSLAGREPQITAVLDRLDAGRSG
jgi:hypothetical protein